MFRVVPIGFILNSSFGLSKPKALFYGDKFAVTLGLFARVVFYWVFAPNLAGELARGKNPLLKILL